MPGQLLLILLPSGQTATVATKLNSQLLALLPDFEKQPLVAFPDALLVRVEDVAKAQAEHLQLLGDDQVRREQQSVRRNHPQIGHGGDNHGGAEHVLRVHVEKAAEVPAHRAQGLVQPCRQRAKGRFRGVCGRWVVEVGVDRADRTAAHQHNEDGRQAKVGGQTADGDFAAGRTQVHEGIVESVQDHLAWR